MKRQKQTHQFRTQSPLSFLGERPEKLGDNGRHIPRKREVPVAQNGNSWLSEIEVNEKKQD